MRQQLQSGVERIDFVSGDVDAILKDFIDIPDVDVPYRVMEIRWLIKNADNYGYTKVGNSWILKSPP